MKKAFIFITTFAVMGTGFFSTPVVAANFEYSAPLETGFKNTQTNNGELKFQSFEKDKLEDRTARINCVGPCDDRNKTLLFLQHQTMTNLPLITGTSELVSSSSVSNQSVHVSHESTGNEAVGNAQ
ncbi:MAG: hypothetical protein RBR37_13765 [Advenella sp.]|nr:hypothetical protein [Advenella sp.]